MPHQKIVNGTPVRSSWARVSLTEQEIDNLARPFLELFARIKFLDRKREAEVRIKFPE